MTYRLMIVAIGDSGYPRHRDAEPGSEKSREADMKQPVAGWSWRLVPLCSPRINSPPPSSSFANDDTIALSIAARPVHPATSNPTRTIDTSHTNLVKDLI